MLKCDIIQIVQNKIPKHEEVANYDFTTYFRCNFDSANKPHYVGLSGSNLELKKRQYKSRRCQLKTVAV